MLGDALETSTDNFLMPPSRYQPLLPGPPEAEAIEDARLEGGGDVMSFLFFTSFTRSLTSNPFNFLLFSLHAHLILLFYFLQATGSTEAQQGSACRAYHVQE